MSQESHDKTNRIAKNTLFLYMRMFIIMLVSLYTSRITLKLLGVTDFGIYNVVGGFVSMLAFLNSSLSQTTQRYLNVEMGKGNFEGMRKVFSMSFWTFIIIALLVIILAETVGLWVLLNVLTIPPDRINAAFWVYQISVIAFVFNVVVTPYNAIIIAYEKMSIYAYYSMIDVFLKLIIVFLLQYIHYDKLILFACLVLTVNIIGGVLYIFTSRRLFNECRISFRWDKIIMKKLFYFSGWISLESIGHIMSNQGVNILMNIFFGPVLNAARAIAMQVFYAVQTFATSFTTAIKPQIIKSYAAENYEYVFKLVYSAAKLCFYLLFLITVPICFNTNLILEIWLDKFPDWAVTFTQLALVDMLIFTSSVPLAILSRASGNIKNFQIVTTIGFLSIVFFIWLLWFCGASVIYAFIIPIIVDCIIYIVKLYILRNDVKLSVNDFFYRVIVPLLKISLISVILALLLYKIVTPHNFLGLIIYTIGTTLEIGSLIYIIGLSKTEHEILRSIIKLPIKKGKIF